MLKLSTNYNSCRSKLDKFDIEQCGFSNSFSDNMLTENCGNGYWGGYTIIRYGKVSLPITSIAIQYVQVVSKGMKAYRGMDNVVRLFRSEVNAQQFREPYEQFCIPTIENKHFVEANVALVAHDIEWVPSSKGSTLCIHPLIFSTEVHIGVRPSTEYSLIIVTTPANKYFENDSIGLTLLVDNKYTRAAIFGGLGSAKATANYAGALLSGKLARKKGFDQVSLVDDADHNYIEEAHFINTLIRLGDNFLAPNLEDCILPRVTRDSLIILLKADGYEGQQRRITINKIVEGSRSGRNDEMFVCDTTLLFASISELLMVGVTYELEFEVPGSITSKLLQDRTGFQYGQLSDQWDWTKILQ